MIKKLAIVFLLLGLACYFVAAVTVLNKPKEGLVCNGVEVFVEDSLQVGFIKAKEVLQVLEKQKCDPNGRLMSEISLKQIEMALLKNPYIKDVTTYKTPGGKVCVSISQRLPVLHVMSEDGQGYYLDRSGKQMPKSSYYANLVVATGHITPQYARQNLTRLGRFLLDDEFWNNQIQQIYVSENGEVELIPRVGEHTILLGPPVRVEDKLARLKEFYIQGLNKVGWNKYSTISLKYDNQVICKKK